MASKSGEDVDMTENSLQSICLDSIASVFTQNKGL